MLPVCNTARSYVDAINCMHDFAHAIMYVLQEDLELCGAVQGDGDVLPARRNDMLSWPVMDLMPVLSASNAWRMWRGAQRLLPSDVCLSNNGVRSLWAAHDILRRKCEQLPGYVGSRTGQQQSISPLQRLVARLQRHVQMASEFPSDYILALLQIFQARLHYLVVAV